MGFVRGSLRDTGLTEEKNRSLLFFRHGWGQIVRRSQLQWQKLPVARPDLSRHIHPQ